MKPLSEVAGDLAVAQLWQVTLVIVAAGLFTRTVCRRRPHLAHLVWLAVLIKCLLPPLWSSPTGVFTWTATRVTTPPVIPQSQVAQPSELMVAGPGNTERSSSLSGSKSTLIKEPDARKDWRLIEVLFMLWGTGSVVYALLASIVTFRCWRSIDRAQSASDERLTAAFGKLTDRLRVTRRTRLAVVDEPLGPLSFGWLHPTIVLPRSLVEGRTAAELEPILAHELVHVRRGDAFVGLLQSVVQGVWWFHPLVWWANRGVVRERERSCDEEVVAGLDYRPDAYTRCLVDILDLKRQLQWLGSLPGLRPFDVTKQRLEHIMRHSAGFRPRMPKHYWLLFLAGVLVIGPGSPFVESSNQAPRAFDEAVKTPKSPSPAHVALVKVAHEAGETESEMPPALVESIPKLGATGVSAGLREIRITFDSDMQRGMSWTGGPPDFPSVDKSRKARWINSRTCVLPVKLEKGRYYRVGINSTSHRNFRGTGGGAVPPTAIYFTTVGASAEVESRVRVPQVVKLEPANGAADVDPATSELRVTFDVPMGTGMSWTGGGPDFPKSTSGSRARWLRDGKTCVMPVALEPGHAYRLGLNSRDFNNFASESGVPLVPVIYEFKTR
jgi:beta-lactamase regulating signal transducer with metallopeptidase domain